MRRFIQAAVVAMFLAGLLPARAHALNDTVVKVDGRAVANLDIQREELAGIRVRGQAEAIPANEVYEVVHGDRVPAFDAGMGAFLAGRYRDAAQRFQEATSVRTPEWAPIYARFWLAETQRALGDADPAQWQAAIQTYEGFLHDNANHILVPRATYGLGETLRLLGRYDQAQEKFNALVEGFQQFGLYWRARGQYGLGMTALALGANHGEEARQFFDVVSHMPEGGGYLDEVKQLATVGLARASMATERWDQAIAILEGIIARATAPEVVASAANLLAECKLRRENTVDAKWQALHAYLQTAIRFPGAREAYAEALFRGSEIAQDLGETALAASLLEELRSRCPDSRYASQRRQ